MRRVFLNEFYRTGIVLSLFFIPLLLIENLKAGFNFVGSLVFILILIILITAIVSFEMMFHKIMLRRLPFEVKGDIYANHCVGEITIESSLDSAFEKCVNLAELVFPNALISKNQIEGFIKITENKKRNFPSVVQLNLAKLHDNLTSISIDSRPLKRNMSLDYGVNQFNIEVFTAFLTHNEWADAGLKHLQKSRERLIRDTYNVQTFLLILFIFVLGLMLFFGYLAIMYLGSYRSWAEQLWFNLLSPKY